jgi:hypothetical protein
MTPASGWLARPLERIIEVGRRRLTQRGGTITVSRGQPQVREMTRRFTFPHVVEIGPAGASRAVMPLVPRPSQRSLVEASLLRSSERAEIAPRDARA